MGQDGCGRTGPGRGARGRLCFPLVAHLLASEGSAFSQLEKPADDADGQSPRSASVRAGADRVRVADGAHELSVVARWAKDGAVAAAVDVGVPANLMRDTAGDASTAFARDVRQSNVPIRLQAAAHRRANAARIFASGSTRLGLRGHAALSSTIVELAVTRPGDGSALLLACAEWHAYTTSVRTLGGV